MLRRILLGVVTLSSVACIEGASEPNEVGSTSQAISSLGACRMTSLYQADAGQPWNDRNVTVADYRQCPSNGPTAPIDTHLTGASIADSLNTLRPGSTLTPAFAPDGSEGAYRVFAPLSKQNHKLLIYLPGGGSATDDKEQLLQRAAYLGYHVLAVRYWNDDGGTTGRCGIGPRSNGKFDETHTSCVDDSACNPYTDTTPITYDQCSIRYYTSAFDNAGPGYTTAHVGNVPAHGAASLCASGPMKDTGQPDLDTCVGIGVGPSINSGDAALYRVRKLLQYLELANPADGWDQFKLPHTEYNDGQSIDWEKVAVMGHSTGSKVLFHVAHDRKVNRAIFLSGPNLPVTRGGLSLPAYLDSYVDTPAKTPVEDIYAFSATHDENYHRAAAIWTYMKGVTSSGMPHTGMLSGPPAPGEVNAGAETIQRVECTGPNRLDDAGVVKECENKPKVPAGNPRALRYSGNVECYVSNTSCGAHTWPAAHTSTTSDQVSCASSDPRSCWYLDIWDYLLVGNR